VDAAHKSGRFPIYAKKPKKEGPASSRPDEDGLSRTKLAGESDRPDSRTWTSFIYRQHLARFCLNPVIDAIRSRRTVKKMDAERPPARSDVETVIEAAIWAPNHHATEPWRFVVVAGEARKRLGAALAAALVTSSTERVAPERLEVERNKPLSSPVIVALIGSPKKGDNNIVPQEEVVAAGAALQNMLLAAYSLGLASFVRTGAHSYSQEVRTFFGMGESETLIGMVYLGYASGAVPPGKRIPFREKTTWLQD